MLDMSFRSEMGCTITVPNTQNLQITPCQNLMLVSTKRSGTPTISITDKNQTSLNHKLCGIKEIHTTG